MFMLQTNTIRNNGMKSVNGILGQIETGQISYLHEIIMHPIESIPNHNIVHDLNFHEIQFLFFPFNRINEYA